MSQPYLRQSTCTDCGARFPFSRNACGLCGGVPLRVERRWHRQGLLHTRVDTGNEDVQRDGRAEYIVQSTKPLPAHLRKLALENTWDMRRMRERVAALRVEERRLSPRAVRVVREPEAAE